MKLEIDVLHADSSAIIFQSPLRNYPSIAIQGDTLFLISSRLKEVREQLTHDALDEERQFLLEYIDEVLSHLNELYVQYGQR